MRWGILQGSIRHGSHSQCCHDVGVRRSKLLGVNVSRLHLSALFCYSVLLQDVMANCAMWWVNFLEIL